MVDGDLRVAWVFEGGMEGSKDQRPQIKFGLLKGVAVDKIRIINGYVKS